jgi:hypothetical protein
MDIKGIQKICVANFKLGRATHGIYIYISMLKSKDIFPNTHAIDYDTQILWNMLLIK